MSEQMQRGDVRVEQVEGHVGVATLCRPPHNFFDPQLIDDLASVFEAFDADPQVRAVVLAADGSSFCAGANFGGGGDTDGRSRDKSGAPTDPGALYRNAVRLFRCTKPVVAAVQGPAIGGGFGLALMPDFRIGCRETRFAANFVKLGIHPGFGLSETLPRAIGVQRAATMFYTGQRISGEQALAWGLLDRLVEQAEVRAAAVALAREMAENAPLAVCSVRATMRAGLADRVAKATDHELAEQTRLRATADAKEGVRAVAERRPGRFIGG